MALIDYTFPGKHGAKSLAAYNSNTVPEADLHELEIDQVRQNLETALYARSVVTQYFPQSPLTGTSTVRIDAMGGGGLSALKHDSTPQISEYKFGLQKFSIDTPVVARSVIEELAEIQTHIPVLQRIGEDQGKKLAKFIDETYIIQAIKAGLLTDTPFVDMRGVPGFGGGTQTSVGTAADAKDPAKLLNAFRRLEADMFKRDVSLIEDGAIILTSADVMFTLMSNDQVVDTTIKWSNGTDIQAQVFRSLGIPVVRSNHFVGGQNITNHMLSNSRNDNAYDVDATKVLAVVVSPKALQDGYAYNVRTSKFWDEKELRTYITSRVAMGVGIARPEYAGVIMTE